MRGVFADGAHAFRSLLPISTYRSDMRTLKANSMKGEPIRMQWDSGSLSLPEGDFISMPSLTFVGPAEVVKGCSAFCREGAIFPVAVEDDRRAFALLEPKNYDFDSPRLDHVFRMYKTYHDIMVTDAFKSEWERRNRTGAAFVPLGELADERFDLRAAQA